MNMNMRNMIGLPLVALAGLLSSCVMDSQGRIYPAPVVVGVPGPVVVGPGYPAAGWGPYGEPYFVYGGLYYYNYGGRYCYYNHGHRVYVGQLPSGGHYYRGHHGYR